MNGNHLIAFWGMILYCNEKCCVSQYNANKSQECEFNYIKIVCKIVRMRMTFGSLIS